MKKKLLITVLIISTVIGTSMTAIAGFTPKYKPLSEYGYTGIPSIKVTLPDGVKDAIDKQVEEDIANGDFKLLNTPEITEATYHHKSTYYGDTNRLQIRWNEVEDATSYEILVTKKDGTERTYISNNTSLIIEKGEDDFITGCVMGGTVKVRAVKGDGEVYSLWTEEDTISCNRLFH